MKHLEWAPLAPHTHQLYARTVPVVVRWTKASSSGLRWLITDDGYAFCQTRGATPEELDALLILTALRYNITLEELKT